MNPYINIALTAWTLTFSYKFFLDAAAAYRMKNPYDIWESWWLKASASFLSLFTALLAIGQYIK